MRQLLYNCAPLRFSDHRPVYATFECRVSIVDEAHRDAISEDLYRRRKAEVGDAVSQLGPLEDTEDEDLIGYDAIEPGLPPASSDRQKWWLDHRQPARAQVPIPNGKDGQPMALNPNRPSNPFGHSEEQDWISVSRSSSRASLSSLSSSPYEKVSFPNIMNSSAASTTPRKPPPSQQQQHDQSGLAAKVGRMSVGGEHGTRAEAAPPPPPPRRQGTGSTQAGPSPPPSQRAGVPMPGMQQMQGHMQHLQPSPASSPAPQDSGSRPPPPVAKKPAHLATLSPVPSNASDTGAMAINSPNGAGWAASQRQGPVDLLDSLDEGERDVGQWETLQPSMGR